MHNLDSLPDVLILLVVSIITVVTLRKFRISPVLGYLVFGAVIGDHGLQLIKEPKYTEYLSEFGVVFLLFVIGLELTVERLIKMRLYVFGFGGLQLVCTSVLFVGVFHFFNGLFLDGRLSLGVEIVIAMALTLSSTAIVLQVMGETGKQSSQVGRLSLSVLLMQDFAVVPLLAVLPILKQGGDIMHAIGMSGVKALIAIAAITVFGRLLLRPFFSLIASAKTDEVYVTTTLLIVLGAAWITNELYLSTAMGAFIAGMLIAETEYRNRVEDSITPFQGLFMSLFFLTVGMSIDWRFILSNLSNVLIAAGVLITLKALVIFGLCILFRLGKGVAAHSALLLSQGGEFAFILFKLSASQGIIGQELAQFLLMVVAVTMAVTPLLSLLGGRIEDKFMSCKEAESGEEMLKGVSDLKDHVIIAGFGRVGRVVSYMLEQEQISYVAVDMNASLVKKLREQGFTVYHGDMSNMEIMKRVGIERASAVILSMSDKNSVRKAVRSISKNFKSVSVVGRVEDLKHGRNIKKLGATMTVPTTVETGLQLGSVALQNLGRVEHVILSIKEKIRKNNYTLADEMDLFK